MKKHNSKIMLGIATLSLIGVVYNIIYAIDANAFDLLTLVAFVTLLGLFLGLYRMIGLVRKPTQAMNRSLVLSF